MKDIFVFGLSLRLPRQTADLAGGSLESLADSRVEATDASEAGGERNFAQGQTRFVNQLFCEVQAACLRDCAGCGS